MRKTSEVVATRRIYRELKGLKPGEVISRPVARLIAAAVHRGVDSELRQFAMTGVIKQHQVARLELFYTVRDEPGFQDWAEALRAFITRDQRNSMTRKEESK